MSGRILIVDDEASLRTVLSRVLSRAGYDVQTAESAESALKMLQAAETDDDKEPFSLVVSDVRMPGMDGLALLERILKRHPAPAVVLLTAHGTVDMAVAALKAGATDFITKPYEREELLRVIERALGQQASAAREPSAAASSDDVRTLVGVSPKMRKVMEVIERVADSPSTVLITGESGTGKELVALALHKRSSRRDKPFIRLNAAAIPPTLIEAELFGHEKGAFTGAVAQRLGRFELAHGGSLFLDEIGELPVDMQVKLLRVLQESTFERVGGMRTINVDVRLIAATNRDLHKAIVDGVFREDLFYRLNVVPIVLPPLRERTEDIPVLVETFLRKHNKRLNRQVDSLTADAIALLCRYPWPGNIRELENVLERTVLFAESPRIDVADLPPELVAAVDIADKSSKSSAAPRDLSAVELGDAPLKEVVRQAVTEMERGLIVRALDETHGNVTHAARRLKISRKNLQIKMKDLGLRGADEETRS